MNDIKETTWRGTRAGGGGKTAPVGKCDVVPGDHGGFIIALDPNGRAAMKRDMDLIRRIFLEVQGWEGLQPRTVAFDDVDSLVLGRHVELLFDQGYLEGTKTAAYNETVPAIAVKDMTWEGHEFIGAIGKDEVWSKLKQQFGPKELSTLSLKIVKDVATSAATAYFKQHFGLG